MRLAVTILVGTAVGCGSRAEPVKMPAGAARLEAGAHVVAVDGANLAYEIRGSGPLCIGIPGGPGLDAGYLHSDALERHFTMVYVDPLGTGASGKAPPYSMTKDVDSVERLRVALGVEKVCLLGHSYGGFVAQRYATEHPDHVSGLILYSSGPTTTEEFGAQLQSNLAWFKDKPWYAEALAALSQLESVTTQAEHSALFAKAAAFYFFDWTRDGAKFGPMLARHPIAFEVRSQRNQEVYDVRAKLSAITAPTLIIAGDKDFILGVVPSRWSEQGIKGSKLVVIEQSGHFAHLEQPAAFEQAVAPFAASLH